MEEEPTPKKIKVTEESMEEEPTPKKSKKKKKSKS